MLFLKDINLHFATLGLRGGESVRCPEGMTAVLWAFIGWIIRLLAGDLVRLSGKRQCVSLSPRMGNIYFRF